MFKAFMFLREGQYFLMIFMALVDEGVAKPCLLPCYISVPLFKLENVV